MTRGLSSVQQQLVDLQWRLDAESEALGKLLAADHVDGAAVLGKLDQVTSIEQQVKKVNFTLLVRIVTLYAPMPGTAAIAAADATLRT